ncbi:xanthine dehydrogenase small subunit [Xanthomonas sacchari]|uniref:xanthine dehydrogenase small subunit n=1 Tax=Xanthomonas sacchari TaxID=56458 RepID=UPI0020C2102A|nr:xanthine dehydrogenase small subunit [Xanthomonas sacchari]
MDTVRFLLDGQVMELDAGDPTASVLDLLRYRLGRTGSKEGCAEGDCGACTVLVGELADGDGADAGEQVRWRALNACILFVPMLDGKALLTVESLAVGGALHAVQQELVQRHGSQCGFCTPGFVMSLYARSIGALGTGQAAVADVLAGNLCRCTGYGPILDAGAAVPPAPRDDAATLAGLRALRRTAALAQPQADAATGRARRASTPRSADALAALLLQRPDARLVAGATDVGLWVTKQQRVLEDVVFIGDIPELRRLQDTADGLRIGACVRYSEAQAALAALHPALGELLRRIGGTQVRNAGTIGGNIANGSPIGDMPPALIALGARLTLRRGDVRRTLPLEDFFLAYGRQALQPGEFVEHVDVPRPPADLLYRVDKLSKRFDSDISAVCGAFALRIGDGTVRQARIAFGGMAGTPQRARGAEQALLGQPWNAATVEAAAAALAQDFQPLSDVRGSAGYRLGVAANLLRRLWIGHAHPHEPLSVLELADG